MLPPDSFFNTPKAVPIERLSWALAQNRGVEVALLREDTLHLDISGNKFRKLKYNLLDAREKGFKKLLTFGGAFSNHIAATAVAAQHFQCEAVGVIRGEEWAAKVAENPTLSFAAENGMQLHFVSRSDYKLKTNPAFIKDLKALFGSFYLVPEGGSNALAVKGCTEILQAACSDFSIIAVAVGTGGTMAGLVQSAQPHQQIWGFPALKGSFLSAEICKFAGVSPHRFRLIENYHLGGYAKCPLELVDFLNRFYTETGVCLDPIYTGKMMFGLADLIESGKIPEGSRVLAVHTGGLQGIKGMNLRLKSKGLPLIDYEN